MRFLVALLAFCLPFEAVAQGGSLPCFTEASKARAAGQLRPIFGERTIYRPIGDGRVVLDCEQGADRRLTCAIAEEPSSPYDLGAVALAFAGELETCSAEPVRFRLPILFTN
jgi:hypothetical protein